MSNYRPKPGTVLRGDDGEALVVEPGTEVLAALLDMLVECYGGEPFAADNPAVVAALAFTKVQEWRSCTKPWMESQGLDPDDYNGYWAPDGDGARVTMVAHYSGGSVYQLGEAANRCEQIPALGVPHE